MLSGGSRDPNRGSLAPVQYVKVYPPHAVEALRRRRMVPGSSMRGNTMTVVGGAFVR